MPLFSSTSLLGPGVHSVWGVAKCHQLKVFRVRKYIVRHSTQINRPVCQLDILLPHTTAVQIELESTKTDTLPFRHQQEQTLTFLLSCALLPRLICLGKDGGRVCSSDGEGVSVAKLPSAGDFGKECEAGECGEEKMEAEDAGGEF